MHFLASVRRPQGPHSRFSVGGWLVLTLQGLESAFEEPVVSPAAHGSKHEACMKTNVEKRIVEILVRSNTNDACPEPRYPSRIIGLGDWQRLSRFQTDLHLLHYSIKQITTSSPHTPRCHWRVVALAPRRRSSLVRAHSLGQPRLLLEVLATVSSICHCSGHGWFLPAWNSETPRSCRPTLASVQSHANSNIPIFDQVEVGPRHGRTVRTDNTENGVAYTMQCSLLVHPLGW